MKNKIKINVWNDNMNDVKCFGRELFIECPVGRKSVKSSLVRVSSQALQIGLPFFDPVFHLVFKIYFMLCQRDVSVFKKKYI